MNQIVRQAVENDPLIPSSSSLRNADATKKSSSAVPFGTQVGPLEISASRRHGILVGLWMATFISAANMTLIPTMMPSISSDFNKSNQASWLGTSYLLATCTFTPLYGRLCNILGRRGACQTAIFFQGLGILACGLSGSMKMLILARFVESAAAAFSRSQVTSDMYSMRERGLTQGFQSLFSGFGMGLGGPFGGIISDWLGWRWAFFLQIPLGVLSFAFVTYNLTYVTPGEGKSTKEVLKRIDYGGIFGLLGAVGSSLLFLSTKYNENLPWKDATVFVPLILSVVFFILFVANETLFAVEPMLAPFLLRSKVPVLVGVSNFFVANCNFAVTYFFPMWFQTVMLTSASTAGAHLFPNSISMSTGAVFAGWVIHVTGRYKKLGTVFGILPFISTILIARGTERSPPAQLWLSIIPLGFGNAVVLQTTLIALLAHLPDSSMAIGTGFGQLFRGVGQVCGVAVGSALFQSSLNRELRRRIHGPNAEEMITKITRSARLVSSLPPDLQRSARDSYAISINTVFVFASVTTGISYIVRLFIPDKKLEEKPDKLQTVTRSDDPRQGLRSSSSSQSSTDRRAVDES